MLERGTELRVEYVPSPKKAERGENGLVPLSNFGEGSGVR